jgi:hypothetical protein
MKTLPLAGAAGLLAFASLLGPMPDAHAQTVYRCGNTYSSTPCEGGTAVNAADPRSAEQARAAQQASKREAAQAKALQQSRERAEAAQAKADAAAATAERQATERAAKAKAAEQKRLAQAKTGGAVKRKRGCVASEKVSCPDFVAADPVPEKATKKK